MPLDFNVSTFLKIKKKKNAVFGRIGYQAFAIFPRVITRVDSPSSRTKNIRGERHSGSPAAFVRPHDHGRNLT